MPWNRTQSTSTSTSFFCSGATSWPQLSAPAFFATCNHLLIWPLRRACHDHIRNCRNNSRPDRDAKHVICWNLHHFAKAPATAAPPFHGDLQPCLTKHNGTVTSTSRLIQSNTVHSANSSGHDHRRNRRNNSRPSRDPNAPCAVCRHYRFVRWCNDLRGVMLEAMYWLRWCTLI